MSEKITAPFTEEQVLSLNGFQASGVMHPFTCGECPRVLVAIEFGWVCPRTECGYRQDWAHSFMADGSWRKAVTALTDLSVGINDPPGECADTGNASAETDPIFEKALFMLREHRGDNLRESEWIEDMSEWPVTVAALSGRISALYRAQHFGNCIFPDKIEDDSALQLRVNLMLAVADMAACSMLFLEYILAHTCRWCMCTDDDPCEGGCEWVEPGLCSNPACLAKDKEAKPHAG